MTHHFVTCPCLSSQEKKVSSAYPQFLYCNKSESNVITNVIKTRMSKCCLCSSSLSYYFGSIFSHGISTKLDQSSFKQISLQCRSQGTALISYALQWTVCQDFWGRHDRTSATVTWALPRESSPILLKENLIAVIILNRHLFCTKHVQTFQVSMLWPFFWWEGAAAVQTNEANQWLTQRQG